MDGSSDQQNSEEKMMKFLTEMEVLQRTDPESFAKFLTSMGMDDNDDSSEESKLGRQSIIEAISQLRAAKVATTDGEIELPGGQTLSGGEVKAKQKGIEITPEPGFTLKTKMNSGSKVFINICKHPELTIPSIKKKLDENGEEIEGMNIPLSAGPARAGKDKSGVDCSIYDVIVNPQVIDDIFADPTGRHRDFICQLAIQSIEQKSKIVLDKRYKLPKLRYMGDITPQTIQDRKSMPNIQDVSSSSSSSSPGASGAKTKSASKGDSNKTPVASEPVIEKPLEYALHWRSSLGDELVAVQYEEDSSASQYAPPLSVPDDDVSHVEFICNFDIADSINISDIKVSLSPYKIQVKVPGYLKTLAYFPCAVLCGDSFDSSASSPNTSTETMPPMSPQKRAAIALATKPTSKLCRIEGYTRLARLTISCPVDRASWSSGPDPGSKSWMIAEALTGGAGSDSNKPKRATDDSKDKSDFPEDKFHIQLPDDVDKYTGMKLDNPDEGEFAEDKFHKQDAVSQYIIEQRERDIKAKWDKHEKEKAERMNDPNVEYIEVDDFKTGGKYGPQPSDLEAVALGIQSAQQEELKKAADVVASSFLSTAGDSTTEGGEGKSPLDLSSNLWTELLD